MILLNSKSLVRPAYPAKLDRSNPITNGLVGYWPLSEGVGTTAYDLSGMGNHGTLVNAPVSTSDKFGKVLKFNGVANNQYIPLKSSQLLYNAPEFTISAWIQLGRINVENFIYSEDYSGGVIFILRTSTNGKIEFQIYNGSAWIILDGATTLNINKRYHVVITRDSNRLTKIYLNSIIDASAIGQTYYNQPITSVQIGRYTNGGGGGSILGELNDFSIYNRVLSAQEVLSLYQNPWQVYEQPQRRVWSSATPQTLTPSLFTNTSVFHAPTVSASYQLNPSLFVNDSVFFAPVVIPGIVTLTPALFVNASVFHAPVVTPGEVTLTPSLFINDSVFYGATVTPSTVTLTPSLFDNISVFFAPAVSASYELTPALFINDSVFYSPDVVPGTVTLTPARFDNSSVFYSPTVRHTLTPSIDRKYTVMAESREYTIASEQRGFSVPAEQRGYTVPIERRNYP